MNFDLEKILSTIENDIIPKTRNSVLKGNKIFGGAILNKNDCSLILADTNHELENPIWHGEMYVLKKFYEQKNHPPTKDLIFLSTHEPCSMCLSAITWAGFDNFIYLFSYEESRDLFAIPHDLNILNQVFNIQDGNYKKSNQYWVSYSIDEILNNGKFKNHTNLQERIINIKKSYDKLSELYQRTKTSNDIPLN
ncbi:MAG: nucleoside deaminase [Paracoccaceae bacterium]